jgi:hypothetical protein
MGVGPGLSASFASAAAARQCLDALDLFARLLIKGGVAEVDVAVQAGVRVVLVFGEWVRAGCSELSSGLVALACSARNPMDEPARTRPSPSGRRLGEPARDTARSKLRPVP